MSTFSGFLDDPNLNFLAIDYFGSQTYNCSAFLLSHVHWDHLQGLFDQSFISMINSSSDKWFYCSKFTAHLLTKFPKFAIDRDKILTIDVNESLIIRQQHIKTDIVITCLAAGHCPGSVMFVIEYLDKRILYTGDFRIRVTELKKVKSRLTNEDGSIIPIDELYLDTTFAFLSELNDFPLRESSEKCIIDRVECWMKEVGSSLKINISLPYRYGIEYLYISLSRKFKKPISVHDYSSYAQVEEIASHVVSFEDANDDDWFIHACMRKRNCSIYQCRNVKTVKPCALTFLFKKNKESLTFDHKYNVPFDYRNGFLKFFYSSHCSLKELQDVVGFLKPTKIFPNVLHDGIQEKDLIQLLRNNDSVRLNAAGGDSDLSKSVLFSRENISINKFDQQKFLEEKERRRLETMKKFNLII